MLGSKEIDPEGAAYTSGNRQQIDDSRRAMVRIANILLINIKYQLLVGS